MENGLGIVGVFPEKHEKRRDAYVLFNNDGAIVKY